MNLTSRISLSALLCAAFLNVSAAGDGTWTKRHAARNAAAVADSRPQRAAVPGGLQKAAKLEAKDVKTEAKRAQTVEQNVLFEDFSLMASGSVGAPDLQTNILSSEGYIYYDYVQTYGWAGINVYQAGGTCYLADGTTALLMTPVLDLSGSGGEFTIRVSFMSDTDTNFYIIALGEGNSEIGSGYVESTDEWQYVEFPVSGGASQSAIQFYADAPVYIDNVSVTQMVEEEEPTSIEAPGTVAATNITADGFTATWSAVTRATSYLLDVFYYAADNEKVYLMTDREVEGTTYDVSGLEPGHLCFFTVQATDGNLVSGESQQVLVKEASASVGTPTALDATEITPEGFRANWTAAENAAWYNLYTYSYHQITETGTFDVEHETFDGFTEGTMDSPLYNGIDVMLNDYTERPNWEGVTTMSCEGMIGLRNYYSVMGYYSTLCSPIYSVGTSSQPGQVTVKIVAARDASCSASTKLGVACVNADDMEGNVEWHFGTFTSSVETFEFTLDSYPNYYIAVAFEDPENNDYGTTGTVWIDEMQISQELQAGDIFCRMHSADVVFDATSFYVATPDGGDDSYSYFVQAITNGSQGTISSDYSNEVYVGEMPSGITDVEAGSGVSVSGADGMITVTLDNDSPISVYSASGAAVATVNGRQGVNRIPAAKGMYIVRTGSDATKVIVR